MKGNVIALGVFDGVHIGHRLLLQRTVELAQRLGAASMVYTFSSHPKELFGTAVPLLMSAARRRDVMLELGIDRVEMVPFRTEIANLLPEQFLDQMRAEYGMRGAVAGYNYRFGRGHAGDPGALARYGQRCGVAVEVIPAILYAGEPVSSSRIRNCLSQGDVVQANAMLGEPYSLAGQVAGHGVREGFPVVLLGPGPGWLLPAPGIYAAQALIQGARYPALASVGRGLDGARALEAHLPEWEGSLPGRALRVRFLERLRKDACFGDEGYFARHVVEDINRLRAVS